jgi:hypothetical protein
MRQSIGALTATVRHPRPEGTTLIGENCARRISTPTPFACSAWPKVAQPQLRKWTTSSRYRPEEAMMRVTYRAYADHIIAKKQHVNQHGGGAASRGDDYANATEWAATRTRPRN